MSATRPGQIDPIHGQAKPSKLRQRRKRIIVPDAKWCNIPDHPPGEHFCPPQRGKGEK